MKLKFYHPLWVHIPAVCLLATLVTSTLLARPLWQLHVVTSRYPTGIVSGTIPAMEAIAAMLLTALLFIGASIAIDEDWARRESHKRFNWLSLLDELIVGFLAVLSIAYYTMQRERLMDLDIPWLLAAEFSGAGVLLALICELLRPWNPVTDFTRYEIETQAEDVPVRLAAGYRWIYRTRQRVKWLSGAIIAFSILMLSIAYDNAGNPATVYSCMVLAIAIFLLWGGFTVSVTSEQVTVTVGIIGMRVFRLRIADITEATTHAFSPMRDFGGYGIRVNSEMTAFFLSGNYGVKLCVRTGKRYLLGTDHPERLAGVIQLAMAAQAAREEQVKLPAESEHHRADSEDVGVAEG